MPTSCGVAVEVVAGISLPVDVAAVLAILHDVSLVSRLGCDRVVVDCVYVAAAGEEDGQSELGKEFFTIVFILRFYFLCKDTK